MTAEEQELVDALSKLTEEERAEAAAFFGLDWKDSGTYQLSDSKSTLSIPEGYSLLLGEDAKQARTLGKEPPSEYMEAVVYDNALENVVIFESYMERYVSLDD